MKKKLKLIFLFFNQQPQKEDTEAAAAVPAVETPTETPAATTDDKTPISEEAPKAAAEIITETPKVDVKEPEQPKVEIETAPITIPTPAAPIIVETVTEETIVESVITAAPIIEIEETKPEAVVVEEEVKTPEPIVVVVEETIKPIEIVDDTEKVDEQKEETADEKIDEPKIEVKEEEEIKEILKEETTVEIADSTVNPPPPLPSNPPPSQVSVFAESAMSNSNDSPLAPETVLVDNKLEVLSEITPVAIEKVEEEIKEVQAPVVEETIEKIIEQVVQAELKPEIIETELPKKEEEEEIAPIEAQPLEESSEDPKPEQIAETIALIEKAAEETQLNLDESLLPPPPLEQIESVISVTEELKDELNISVDVSSPIAQNSLESLPSPPLSSSQSENLPPPPPVINEETTITAAASSSLPSPPLSDSSLTAEKLEEILTELPAEQIIDEIKNEIIPEAEILPHINGNGIKEEDGVQQQQMDKVNNPEKKKQKKI